MKGAVVGEGSIRAVALGVKENRAEFERCVVGNAKLLVGAETSRAGVG